MLDVAAVLDPPLTALLCKTISILPPVWYESSQPCHIIFCWKGFSKYLQLVRKSKSSDVLISFMVL